MRRLFLVFALLLSGGIAFAQSGGSSATGGGLSTKAILALEDCFDDFDTFVCGGGGAGTGTVGPGTVNRIAKFTAVNTVDDSNLVDTGTNLSGVYGGTVSLTSTGDMTFTTSDNMFLTATTDINIPDDVELNFGTTATAGGPGNIVWNTFAGGGIERLEIDGTGNAGVLITAGNGTTGSFGIVDGSGSFIHNFTQNPPIVAGGSGPSWVMAATGVSSMDDAADQRVGLDVDPESGATDVAGSQQIGIFIEGPTARASTQDGLLIGTSWDNQIVVGDETNRTALRWAAVVGNEVITVPSDTGTIVLDTTAVAAVFPLTANTIVTNSGVQMQFGGAGTSISSDGAELTIDATGGNGESIVIGSGNDDGIFIDAAGETLSMISSGGALVIGDGDEEMEINVDLIQGTIADDLTYATGGGWFVSAAANTALASLDFNAPPAAGAGDNIFSMNVSLNAFDGSDEATILNINPVSIAVATGANNLLYGIRIESLTDQANTEERAITIDEGWEVDILFNETAADILFQDSLNLGNDGGVSGFLLDSAPVSSASADLATLSATLVPFDGSDVVRGHVIDITNANHVGAGNFVTGLDVEAITGDTEATETAIEVGTGWDAALLIPDDVPIQIGGTERTLVGTTPFGSNITLENSTASGEITILASGSSGIAELRTSDAGGSVGLFTLANSVSLSASSLGLTVGDDDTIVTSEVGFDFIADSDGSVAESPAANRVKLYLDEANDHGSGAATADCALVARLSSGTEVVVAVLVTDAGCP